MFARHRMLSIVTTRQCTAACDHCCVGASPRATAKIPVERIHGLIDEAKRIPSIDRVVFTGGECFLLGRELDGLIAHAHELELTTRVITNGYWAVNGRSARERVRTLQTAGLDEMMLSTGTFHQQFVPVARVAHAARAAAAAGIVTRISIEDCDQTTFDDTNLRAELSDAIGAGTIVVSRDPWIRDAGGRGTTAITHERRLARDGADDGRCAQILNVITVTPDQQLLSCCGFPMEELPRLRVGSVADAALDDVLRLAPNELLKMWLHVAGPVAIAEFIAEHLPGFSFAASPSICQSCVTLQRDERAMRVLAEHAGEVVDAVAAEFVRLNGGLERLRAF